MNPSGHETHHHSAPVDGHPAAQESSTWAAPTRITWLLAVGSLLGILKQFAAASSSYSSEELNNVLNLPVLVLTVGGILAMCLSPWWSRDRKWIAAAWLLVPNWLAALLAVVLPIDDDVVRWALNVVAVGVRIGALRWLWLSRTAPAPDRERFRLPRWARILCWSVVLLVGVIEVLMWGMSLELLQNSGIKSGSLTP
ncbi:hypothetical protein [Streptomyces mangrovisoli]|uniref:Uncharacterized protein n=1 Tax=Streptomyces mangrovisoli TaxID=1428628 RepID=A0A1J4NVD5_9ACTN|nr:hypothetical protein [Streptomyces mangrovisoli]OIJ66457.1 hypothetical protein WN71_018265 [Streptomyces mangrovisoli]